MCMRSPPVDRQMDSSITKSHLCGRGFGIVNTTIIINWIATRTTAMKDRPKILSSQRLRPAGESSTLSTPKREISWKELSVLLKPIDSRTSRSSKDSRGNVSTLAPSERNSFGQYRENHSSMWENNRDRDRLITTSVASARTTVSSPSTPSDHGRSLSRAPSFSSSSGQKARMEQARAARKLLDLISPDVFVVSHANPDPGLQLKLADSASQMRTPPRRQGPSIFSIKTPLKSPAYGSSAKRNIALALMTPPRHPNSARKASQCKSIE